MHFSTSQKSQLVLFNLLNYSKEKYALRHPKTNGRFFGERDLPYSKPGIRDFIPKWERDSENNHRDYRIDGKLESELRDWRPLFGTLTLKCINLFKYMDARSLPNNMLLSRYLDLLCIWNTQGGQATSQEMCIDFLFYYPRMANIYQFCSSLLYAPIKDFVGKYL